MGHSIVIVGYSGGIYDTLWTCTRNDVTGLSEIVERDEQVDGFYSRQDSCYVYMALFCLR